MAFVQTPGNPEPQGIEELAMEGRGGVPLRMAIAPALGSPRGSVILCSGRTEFIEKYFEIMRELQARGFVVFTMDWRGQGLSGRETKNRLKGHLVTIDDAAADLAEALKLHSARLPRPHIVLAHSMGGGIALRALQTHAIEADGAVFSAPMWGIARLGGGAKGFSRLMTAMGMGHLFAPGVQTRIVAEDFKDNPVTHDETRHARCQALVAAEPRLALAGPTFAWIAAASDAIEGFVKRDALSHLQIPIVVLSGSQEKLVDNRSHKKVTARLPNAERRVIEGARHEIMMETDDIRAQFWAAFDAVADRAAPRGAA
ncbi:MAG: alpha/beta fold hydrolase [Hyphomonadaceae bacterium]